MKKVIILSFISLLLIGACTINCPDDEKIGAISLTEQSLAFFPYKGDQKLVFKSDEGEEIRFSSDDGGVHTESYKISIYKTCSEFKYDGGSSYEYFEGENKHAVYFCQDPPLSFNIGLYTTILRPEQELFFDKLLVDVMSVGSVGRGEIATDIRFTEHYEEQELNFNAPMQFTDEVTLNGVTYTNVYKSKLFEQAQIFYTKSQGLVGFTTNDAESKTYNLIGIE